MYVNILNIYLKGLNFGLLQKIKIILTINNKLNIIAK